MGVSQEFLSSTLGEIFWNIRHMMLPAPASGTFVFDDEMRLYESQYIDARSGEF
jgi:hypothetical protein